VLSKTREDHARPYDWALPEKLEIPPDPLRLRLDFHHQAVVLYTFEGEVVATKIVAAMEVAHSLAEELSFGTGLLPKNTLWWTNTKSGPVYALWEEAKVWKVALQEGALESPRRFTIPLPGLIFLCTPGQPPWVFSMKRKPSKLSDLVYRCPLCNVFQSGKVCPGNHKFPLDIGKIPDSFFRSFFSPTADLSHRSEMFPENVVHLWEFLDGKKRYPMKDLIRHGTVKDLMNMNME